MKKLLHFLLAAVIAATGMSIFAEDTPDIIYGVQVMVDGEKVDFPDQQPLIADDRTLVPVRGVFEKLGAKVSYLEESESVQIIYETITINFPIGSKTVSVTKDGKTESKTLDTATLLIADRTMVPLRFAAQTIGASVLWDEETKTVTIETKEQTPIPPEAEPGKIQPGDIQPAYRVSSGRNNLAAVKDDGTVWVQGKGDSGQLGGLSSSGTPVRIQGIDGAIAVACGKNTIYALRSDGTVWSWGSNTNGALGTGTDAENTAVPIQVKNLPEITAISAGEAHILALDKQGNVYAWGSNRRGQLGVGDTENRSVPVLIDSLKKVTAISAGTDHSCAVTGGEVYTWGGNGYQQLGGRKNANYVTTPQNIRTVTKIVDVKAGGTFTLAVRSDGSIYEWGTVYVGELGSEDEKDIADSEGNFLIEEPMKLQYIYQEEENGPYMARVLTKPEVLACGDRHAAAIKDGTIYAWGDSALFKPRDKSQTLRVHAFPYGGSDSYTAVYTGRERELFALDDAKQLWKIDTALGKERILDLSK